jgi:hypothetical protein
MRIHQKGVMCKGGITPCMGGPGGGIMGFSQFVHTVPPDELRIGTPDHVALVERGASRYKSIPSYFMDGEGWVAACPACWAMGTKEVK